METTRKLALSALSRLPKLFPPRCLPVSSKVVSLIWMEAGDSRLLEFHLFHGYIHCPDEVLDKDFLGSQSWWLLECLLYICKV